MPAALVQEADAASASVTLGSGTTAGNTVIVAVACLGPAQATGVTGVTLGGSPDNFTPIAPGPSARDTTSPNDYLNVSVWADADCAGAATAVTVTGTGVLATWVYEFSGLAGTADISKVFSVSTYQDSWLATTAQASLPAEAWIAVIGAANQVGAETLTVTSGSGWATETAYNGTSGSYYWGAVSAYQTVNTVGTPSFSGFFSQPSFSAVAIVTLGAGTPPTAVVVSAPLTGNVAVRGGGLAVHGDVAAGGVVTQGGTPVMLTPVGPKTGNYAARPGDFVLANCTVGAVTVTLPAAPANGSLVGVKLVNSVSGTLTVQASGTDVIDAVPAATTQIVPVVTGTVFVLQYQSVTGTWYTQSTGTQLPVPPPLNNPQPADAGFAAWSYDYAMLGGSFTGVPLPPGGNAYLVKCPVRTTANLAAIRYWITAAGSGLTTAQNFAGVYSSEGSLITVTADMTAGWGSTTGQVDTLFSGEPFTINPPYVWAAFLCNGGTGPSLAVTGNQTASWANGLLASNQPRFGHLTAAHTTLPATFSLLGAAASAAEYWVGLY